ncbi:MAG TPA: SMP-30/gluconolactonase/LRE family protein, partial [Pirellulales bacterium]|nr:SMP-30/gluconolactonase/LRE family protein [Pirellulales bacterium]
GVEQRPNLTFARYGERTLQLDLFRPQQRDQPLPAVVCIHGGGWYTGDRTSMVPLAQALAARGFVAVAISYRLSGEAKFPAAIEDCKAAVRWLRTNADEYGVDPRAIGATGLSAGGHLAALLATSGDLGELEGGGGDAGQSSRVQAAVAMGAQSDLESARIGELSRPPSDPFYRTFLGGSQDDVPQHYAAASPRHHLDRNDPPLLFMTGELDDPSTHAVDTRRDLMRLGIATGLVVIPQAPHGFLGREPWFTTALDATAGFFDRYLRDGGNAPLAFSSEALRDKLFPADAQWRRLGGGYAGCEGAQWIDEQGAPTLLFAAQHDHLAMRWTQREGLRAWRDDSPEATSFRPAGHGGYYVVEQTQRRLVRWGADGHVEVLAEKFDGKRLNRPNDVVVKSDGTLWFTDPNYLFKPRPQEKQELPGQYVFRFDPRTAELRVAASDVAMPNGIAFSPDQQSLFVTDAAGDSIFRWPVEPAGSLGKRETFAKVPCKGLDGLAFDPQGHLWCAARDGVHVFTPEGRELGVFALPEKPTSIAFYDGSQRWVCVTTREAA